MKKIRYVYMIVKTLWHRWRFSAFRAKVVHDVVNGMTELQNPAPKDFKHLD